MNKMLQEESKQLNEQIIVLKKVSYKIFNNNTVYIIL